MSVLQESVRKSIDNNLPIIQDGIRGEIRDSTKAMQKLISAPTREFSGETAMAVNTLISPKLESMISMIRQVALLVEVASLSPQHSALGDAASETTSSYKILNDILQSHRNMQYEISKGYEVLNSLVMDMQATIEREGRKENEKESQLQGYFRNVKSFKQLFRNESLESNSQMAVEQVLNYIETTSQLHAQLEMHISEYGGDINNSEWELREDTQPEYEYESNLFTIYSRRVTIGADITLVFLFHD
jgi:hypothetical protein